MSSTTLRAGLMLDTTDFSRNLTAAAARMRTFSQNITRGHSDMVNSLNKYKFGLKDTARIVQGIVVAQTFYAMIGAIRDATSALARFNETLDYTQVTYSALFGSTQLASDFSKVLQEAAVNSIFDYESLLGSSKKLLAYGIEYENLMYIMEGLMDLGSMSGDTAALDRIALALGQIQARGKITAEEMRQLSNAYVPIQEILQENFNLTPKQMGDIGGQNLPAHEVINAIVDYANEKLGDVADAAMFTITGLKNRVVDTMKVMGSEMTMPITRAWKSFLKYAADGLQGLRDTFQASGWGGVFEQLVPDPDTQTTIRAFLANLHNGFMAFASLMAGLKPIISNIGQAFIVAFNIVAPIVNNAANALGAFLHILSQNSVAMAVLRAATIAAAGAFILLKAHALSSLVIAAVGKAINFVSKSLIVLSAIVSKHPLLMLMAGLAVALIGVSAAANNTDNSLSKLFKTLSGAGGGVTQEDIFKKITGESEKATNEIDKFNDRLDASKDAAKGLGDNINKAGKKAADAAKGLLSFDEVFKLPEKQENAASGDGAGAGVAGDIDGLISGLGSLGDALIPNIPDFSEFTDKFTEGLFGDLYASVARIMHGAGSGALVGALVGFALGAIITNSLAGALAGAKLGTKIGAIAGAGFAAFWGDTYDKLAESIGKIAISGGAGALAGALAGFVIGAFATKTLAGAITGAQWGAGAGALVGVIIGSLFDDFANIISERIKAIASGGAEGMLVGALAGMIIGAFATKTLAGAMTGARIGAGLGVAAGGIIGAIFGDTEKSMKELLSNLFSDISAASYGAVIGGFVGMIVGAIVGALAGGIGAIPGAKLGASLGSAVGGLGTLLASYLTNAGVFDAIENWLVNLFNAIPGVFAKCVSVLASIGQMIAQGVMKGLEYLKNLPIVRLITAFHLLLTGLFKSIFGIHSPATEMEPIGVNIILGVLEGIKNGFNTLINWIANVASSIGDTFSNWWSAISQGWSDWWSETKTNWSDGWTEVKNNASAKWAEIKSGLTTWLDEQLKKNGTSLDEVKKKWSDKWNEVKSNASTTWTNIKNYFAPFIEYITSDNETKLEIIKTSWSNKWTSIKTNASKLWATVKISFTTWLDELLQKNGTSLDEVKKTWSDKWTEVKTNMSNWWTEFKKSMGTWLEDNVWQPIADFFNVENFWNRIKDMLAGIKRKVSGWWTDLKDMFSGGLTINASVNTNTPGMSGMAGYAVESMLGHATGGIFNREHIARFAEGNKAEAIIPLENRSAMQPFVNAVSRGLLEELAPAIVGNSGNSSSNGLPPMYVGTLIADERGIKELYKKFEIIELQENARRGLAKS